MKQILIRCRNQRHCQPTFPSCLMMRIFCKIKNCWTWYLSLLEVGVDEDVIQTHWGASVPTTDLTELRSWLGLCFLCGVFRNSQVTMELWVLELKPIIIRLIFYHSVSFRGAMDFRVRKCHISRHHVSRSIWVSHKMPQSASCEQLEYRPTSMGKAAHQLSFLLRVELLDLRGWGGWDRKHALVLRCQNAVYDQCPPYQTATNP